jgi:hypothetical protein
LRQGEAAAVSEIQNALLASGFAGRLQQGAGITFGVSGAKNGIPGHQ